MDCKYVMSLFLIWVRSVILLLLQEAKRCLSWKNGVFFVSVLLRHLSLQQTHRGATHSQSNGWFLMEDVSSTDAEHVWKGFLGCKVVLLCLGCCSIALLPSAETMLSHYQLNIEANGCTNSTTVINLDIFCHFIWLGNLIPIRNSPLE